MAPANWQASATYVTSFVNAAKSLGHLTAVLPLLDAETRAMVEAPGSEAWWPGHRLSALCQAMETAAGFEAVKAASIQGSRERMGPLVRPLASVLLSLSKSPVNALISRLNNFVGAGVKGVESRFVPHEGKPGGVVTFVFPEKVPPVVSVLWLGMFDVGFTLARGGRIVSEQKTGTEHRFEITW